MKEGESWKFSVLSVGSSILMICGSIKLCQKALIYLTVTVLNAMRSQGMHTNTSLRRYKYGGRRKMSRSAKTCYGCRRSLIEDSWVYPGFATGDCEMSMCPSCNKIISDGNRRFLRCLNCNKLKVGSDWVNLDLEYHYNVDETVCDTCADILIVSNED